MAEAKDLKADDALKTLEEVKALGFMKLRKYVKAVGLESPKHVTKPILIKLIVKEKKFKETRETADDSDSGASSEFKREINVNKGESPSTIELKKAASPRASRQDSTFNEDAFLSGNQGKANKQIKRFRRHFTQLQSHQIVRPLQNALFVYDMPPEKLVEAVMSPSLDSFQEEFVLRIYHIMHEVVVGDWTNACAAQYDIDADADAKYHRFFRVVSIPQIRDRMVALGDLVSLQQSLNYHHTFTHNVYQALHEIVNDKEKVRYLIAVLLFTRAKNTEKINLNLLKLEWDSLDTKKDSKAIYLLRKLLQRLPVTSQDLWAAERFDHIDESKPRIRMTSPGAIMQKFLDKNSNQEKDDAVEVFETEVEAPKSVKLNALMSELTKKTTRVAPLEIAKEEARKAALPKLSEHQTNLRRLEFRVPNFKLQGVKRRLEVIKQGIDNAGLGGAYDMIIQNLLLSHERLETTNNQLLELWSRAESDYFQAFRTDFMKQMKHPEFLVLMQIVEDQWGLFFPDTVWGTIWEFRAPFERNVDLRFALLAYQDFLKKHGL